MARTKQVARMMPRRGKPANWEIKINGSTVIRCNKEVVISLSPTIAKYVEENPSSKSYDIEFPIESVSNKALNKFSTYLTGDYFFVNIIDVPFYQEISKKLDLKDLSKFLEEASSDVKASCDYAIKNYEKENPFLLELESLEQAIFELNKNNFQSTIKYVLDFFNEDNENERLKYFVRLIYQFCMTRNSQDYFYLGIELIIQIIQKKNQVKKEFIDFLSPKIISDIKMQYFTRALYEKQVFTSEDMKLFINLFKPDRKYENNNFSNLPSNFVFFFDFIIKGLVSNKYEFSGKKIWNNIGTSYKNYPKIECEINPDEKEGVFGSNCFSVNVADKKIINYNISELMENNWELHKKLCREGTNENQIAVLIRNDDLNNFIRYVSENSEFNFDSKIPFSIYDRESKLQDCTLIQYAAFYSSIKIFKYLLVQKAEIKECIYNYAFAGGDLELIHLCEENLISDNTESRRILFFLGNEFPRYYETSIEYHHNDILRWVLETKKIQYRSGNVISDQSPAIQMDYNSNLIYLCLQNSNFISLHYLLTQELYYPGILAYAINFNLMDLAKFSLNFKFLQRDDSKLNGNAFYEACNSNNIEYLKLFIEDKSILPYQKERRYTDSFINAVSKNKCDFVELILSNLTKMDINIKSHMDESPLYIACKNGFAELLQILIKYHLNDMKFNEIERYETIFFFLNKTPLQIACKNGHLEVVKLLLSTKKVDLNLDNGNGKKPLYYALVSGNIELIKLLGSVLQPEEDKEKINFYFIPACRSGNLELIQLFLNKYGDLIDINTNECPSECISIFFFFLSR